MANKNKRITTNDIAKYAGVSQSTVSLVLTGKSGASISEETVRRVMDAAVITGYIQPDEAQNNTLLPDMTVGFIVPDLINPSFADNLSRASVFMARHNIDLIVCNTEKNSEREIRFINHLMERKVDGLIFTVTPSKPEMLEKINRKIPIVVIGETEAAANIPTVGINSVTAGELVMEHLYNLGHRRIAYITPPIQSVSILRHRRLQGMKNFLGERDGLGTFHVYEQAAYTQWNEDSFEVGMGYEQTRFALRDHPEVTAIIAQGDMIAIGVYKAIKEAGLRIPEDISVVGFDNIEMSKYITPRLTTVDYYNEMRSRQAFEYILDCLRSTNTGSLFVEYRPRVVVRESTSPARE